MSGQMKMVDDKSSPNKRENITQELDVISIQKDIAGANLADLVPEDALLALTRGYSIQSGHISRILQLSYEKHSRGELIRRDDIAEELAVSWARVQGTINVMRRAALLRPKNALTLLGESVLQHSPFLDNVGVLWLLHYFVASDANLVLWSHLFNNLERTELAFTINDISDEYRFLEGRWSETTLKDKVPKEIGGILRCYTEEFLTQIGLISLISTGKYFVNSNTGIIPPLVWLSAILVYRDRYYPEVPSLETHLLINANFSPGRLFKQSEAAVRRALDELHNAGLLTVEARSGLDQIRFKREISWLSAIKEYLQGEIVS